MLLDIVERRDAEVVPPPVRELDHVCGLVEAAHVEDLAAVPYLEVSTITAILTIATAGGRCEAGGAISECTSAVTLAILTKAILTMATASGRCDLP